MAGLNFKHLRYFWMVAKSGSIARASEMLHVTPQSISGQLSEFENALGVQLFRRAGRGLELTETGQRMLSYAEQIFTLGNELLESLREDALPQATPFRVGIADSVPKMVAYRLVEPSLGSSEPIKLICREGRLTALLGDMAVHRLDMVIADRPMPDNVNVRGYAHFLGESGVSIFAAPALQTRAAAAFPRGLDNKPFLMPGADVALHSRLLRWFESERLRPRIVGEFDDSALLMAFGQAGAGFFAAPTAIEDYIAHQYEVEVAGRIEVVREQIYAITNERKLTHPIVSAICQFAQHDMFGGQGSKKAKV
ncbi:MAG: transcriptional activator NhaR [Azonexus sp.]|nr:transcriptional activator NhaR [Betaproteobacteria bacterium]MBK8917164.1 transcriptional activator NhaR [Betaproteobacteria bacterium]MBP6035560.1 transcriptional activator NhaR [Azonexus sp.]MBP6906206.1 transcriptional activator NhaR [Azonexus sp.]